MPKFAANLSMLFRERPFLDRFAAARAAGFEAVEVQFPYAHPAAEIAARLSGEGLALVLHNLPAGDWVAGERGIAALAGREQDFRDGVSRALDYAQALDCPQLNCLAGIPSGEDAEAQEVFVANLDFAAEALDRAGRRLLIEPINVFDMPGFHLTRTAQALKTVRAVGRRNLFVQYDAYHMHLMGEEVPAMIAANLDAIAHIQLADAPGRHEPGTGEIDFPHLFGCLDHIGYAGWIGCEYLPAGDTVAGLGWMPRG